MADVIGRLADLYMDDQTDTCRQVRGDLNNITFTRTKNNPEVTTFGDNTVQRLADGLRDVTMDFSGIFATDGAATAIVGMLDTLYLSGCITRIQYLPAGSTTGCPIYTACYVLSSIAHNTPVDGPATVNFSAQIASGSLTAACAV